MSTKFVCQECHKEYSLDQPIWRCSCGGLLELRSKVKKFRVVDEDRSLWRYRELLPIKDQSAIVTLGEGMTPLLKQKLGGHQVYVKLEFLSPTGSYKDRGAAVMLSKIREWGIKQIVEDSSGNAGAAIAAYAAAAGIECEIYLPAETSAGKIKQIRAYGSKVVKVSGNRDATSSAVMEKASSVYYASHSWNPLFFEGTKTMAYELWEQLGGISPEIIILPVGNGTMLLGAYLGFRDLLELEMIPGLPRFIAIQSAHCTPVYAEFNSLPDKVVTPTVAEGISVGNPVRKRDIVEAVRATAGVVLTVGDEDVLHGVEELAKQGIYVEPTSGTVAAGFYQALRKGMIPAKANVVLPLTGSGLKKG